MRKCRLCVKHVPTIFFNINGRTGSLNKTCNICIGKMKDSIDRKKNKPIHDPNYKVVLAVIGGGACDTDSISKYTTNDLLQKYYKYISNLHIKARIQLRSDLRRGVYGLEWVINSGQYDGFGSYTEEVMKSMRL